MNPSVLISVAVLFISSVVSIFSFFRCRRSFYGDTPWLWWMGIYIWGDALVLAPFWFLSGIFFWFLVPLDIFRFYLLFLAIRGAYEVIYWINHQFSAKDYQAPLFRRFTWISSHESAILYQLMNMCVVVMTIAVLVISYSAGG